MSSANLRSGQERRPKLLLLLLLLLRLSRRNVAEGRMRANGSSIVIVRESLSPRKRGRTTLCRNGLASSAAGYWFPAFAGATNKTLLPVAHMRCNVHCLPNSFFVMAVMALL